MAEFGITREQLKFLVRDRDSDALSRIEGSGGVRGIAGRLLVDPDSGLKQSVSEFQTRRDVFGMNYVPPPKPRSYFSFLKDAFGDLTIMILCVSALADLGIAIGYAHSSSSYAESAAILLSIVVVTNVAAGNDFRKQSQFRKLNAQVDNMPVIVIRGGEKVTVPMSEVVVGDVVTLSVGDIVCADGLLLVSHGVEMDESSLTGETKSVRKSVTESPFVLSGTKAMDGSGLFLAVAVGENSEAGQIRMIVQGGGKKKASESEGENTEDATEEIGELKSVLTTKLDDLATRIGKLGTLVASVCFIIMVVRFCVTTYAISDPEGKCAIIGGVTCASDSVTSLNPAGGLWPQCGGLMSGTCCVDTDAGALIQGSPCPWLKVHLGQLIGFFITAVTILVVAVPEGLPLAVTLSLAFSVIKMQTDNNLVKHLDACETMGSATTICSDKTGTLTKNRMTVMRAFMGGDSFKPNGAMPVGLSVLGFVEADYDGFEASESGRKKVPLKRSGAKVASSLLQLVAEGVAINSTGDIKWDSRTKLWEQIGNKTECALLQFVEDLGFDYSRVRTEMTTNLVKSFPFNSAKKRSTVVVTDPVDGFRVHVKGASEMVLGCCTKMIDRNGEKVALGPDETAMIESKIQEFASLAMRTICIASKAVTVAQDWEKKQSGDNESLEIESDLVLLAIVGIEDPLRDEVPAAIAKCRRAGVDVRMVTGDNLDTAVAIAKGCGILRPSDLDPDGKPKADCALTGPEFRRRVVSSSGKINQEEFDKIWPHLRVLARSSPTDKFTLVSGLNESDLYATDTGRRLGIYPDRQVVAVTGDGTNDAPALKRADVGFAMGITGTAVAKEAADIILMDDNFSSIVKAIMWGRNVHEGIAKFLQFQLTINIVALVLAIEGSLTASESPLNAVQMLWINLIMDSLASLALATEMPTEEHLNRPPVGRNKSMISGIMAWNICGHVMYQLAVLNVLLFAGPSIFGFPNEFGEGGEAKPSEHNTLIFNTFVLIQLLNQVNMRKLHHEWNLFKGLLSSKFFVIILFVEIGVQVLIIELGGDWFHTKPLSVTSWIVGVVCALGVFPVQWLIIAVATLAHRISPFRKRLVVVPVSAEDSVGVQMTPREKRPSVASQGGTDLAAQLVTKSKRHETSVTMAKNMTKLGDQAARTELAKAGKAFQRKRKSIIHE